jgi:hypothetical protein
LIFLAIASSRCEQQLFGFFGQFLAAKKDIKALSNEIAPDHSFI